MDVSAALPGEVEMPAFCTSCVSRSVSKSQEEVSLAASLESTIQI